MPLLKELSRSSWDSFESESDSKESQDDRLNSPKSGKSKKITFFGKLSRTSWDLSNRNPIRKNPGTFGLTRPKVAFAFFAFFFTHDVDSIFEKRENLEMPLFGELSRSSQDSFESDSDSKESRDVRLYSPKSGISIFSSIFDSIDSIIRSIRSIIRRPWSVDLYVY